MKILLLLIALFWNTENKQQKSIATTDCNDCCLKKLPPQVNYLKGYILHDFKEDKPIEYSYVLTKGTEYTLLLCSGCENIEDIRVDLFDSHRNRVATNMGSNSFVKTLTFPCNSTGIYYMQFSTENKKITPGCGILGFRRIQKTDL
jgi:hypothetical protein